jgi:cob(I)alamin adenosyltransferase
VLHKTQHDLFGLGAQLSTGEQYITEDDITSLEEEIDKIELSVKPLTEFILPYHPNGVTEVHIARAVCRRAERCVIKWRDDSPYYNSARFADCIIYLNRLSDYLFMFARQVSVGEETWKKRESKKADIVKSM